VPSLLVTNDFPPKVGGIQSYLHELWRRLPPGDTTVLTTRYPGDREFDAAQPFRIERTRRRVLLPSRALVRHVDALAHEVAADVVFLDPLLPLGLIGPRLRSAPYVVVTHGAEVTVAGRLPGVRRLARRVLHGAAGVVAAGEYPAREAARAAGRPLSGAVIPPGVDVDRFRPLDDAARRDVRERLGFDPMKPLVLGVSRLVPRKGFDVLLHSLTWLGGPVQLAVAGSGRDRRRLGRWARGLGDRVRFLDRVPDADLPAVYGSADVFAVPCRERWGGLEAEGFGIVFLEAAACAVPAVAGRSGGSHEAVADGETGYVVDARDLRALRDALEALLGDASLRSSLGAAARRRAVERFSYERLVERLVPLARGDLGALEPLAGP
jgi:phosphatidyl-myo-inositol dimannoside synthase